MFNLLIKKIYADLTYVDVQQLAPLNDVRLREPGLSVDFQGQGILGNSECFREFLMSSVFLNDSSAQLVVSEGHKHSSFLASPIGYYHAKA